MLEVEVSANESISDFRKDLIDVSARIAINLSIQHKRIFYEINKV